MPIVSKRLKGRWEEGSAGSFPGLRTHHSSVLPRLGKVMAAENRIEDMGEEGNRSLGKMLLGPVRDTVRARSLTDLDTPDGVVNLVRGS